MSQKCFECGMVDFHKPSCSKPYKSIEALKTNFEKLKEIQYYKFQERR